MKLQKRLANDQQKLSGLAQLRPKVNNFVSPNQKDRKQYEDYQGESDGHKSKEEQFQQIHRQYIAKQNDNPFGMKQHGFGQKFSGHNGPPDDLQTIKYLQRVQSKVQSQQIDQKIVHSRLNSAKRLSQTIQADHGSKQMNYELPLEIKTFYYRGDQGTEQKQPNIFLMKTKKKFQIKKRKEVIQSSNISENQKDFSLNRQSKLNDLQTIGVLDWTDSDENKHQKMVSQQLIEQSEVANNQSLTLKEDSIIINEQQQRDFRMQFLQKMTLIDIDDTLVEIEDTQKPLLVVKDESLNLDKLQKTIKLQKWVRSVTYEKKQLQATRAILKANHSKRFPLIENSAAILIQKRVRQFLGLKDIGSRKGEKNFLILRTSFIEPIFWDEEQNVVKQRTFCNQKFWFRLSITKPHEMIKISIAPFDKKYCLSDLQKGFRVEIPVKIFYLTIIVLDQYIQLQQSSVNEDESLTRTLKQISKIARWLIIPSQNTQGLLDYKFIDDKVQALEDNLSKMAPQLEKILRIEQNKRLIMLGFNDFKYDMYLKPADMEIRKEKPLLDIESIKRIQKQIRGYLQQKQTQQLKQIKQNQIINYFTILTIVDDVREYLRVYIIRNKITQKESIYCRIESTKKSSNQLPLYETINKILGYPDQTTFLEIYQIQIKEAKLEHTAEALHWIKKDKKNSKSAPKITMRMMNRAATLIQSALRQYQIQQDLSIRILQQKRVEATQKSGITEKSIYRKVSIQGQSSKKRAFFMNFILQTEKFTNDHKSNQMSQKQVELMQLLTNQRPDLDKIQQAIIIKTKILDHSHSNEEIRTFQQQLFYFIDPNEIVNIAYKMLEIARVESGKSNILQLNVKYVEEVQGILINEQNLSKGGKVETKKDGTLEARRIFNLNSQRNKQLFQNTSRFDLAHCPSSNLIEKSHTNHSSTKNLQNQNDQFLQKILHNFQSYNKAKSSYIKISKDVTIYDQVSISEYVRKVDEISNYGYGLGDPIEGKENMHFLREILNQENKKKQQLQEQLDDQEREKNYYLNLEKEQILIEQRSQKLIFSGYCLISSQRVYLKIIFNDNLDQLSVTAQIGSNAKMDESIGQFNSNSYNSLSIYIDKSELIPGTNINEDFMKSHMELIVVRNLNIENDCLSFDPTDLTQEQALEELYKWNQKQLELKEASSNETQSQQQNFAKLLCSYQSLTTSQALQKINHQFFIMEAFNRDFMYESEYIYDFTENYIIMTVYLKSNQKFRCINVFSIQAFDCSYLNESFKLKTPTEITAYLKGTVKAIDKVLLVWQKKNEKNEIILTTNFSDFEANLPNLFRLQFVRKIQSTMRLRQVVSYIQLWKKNRNKTVYLSKTIKNFDGRYVSLKFYLVKSDYTINLLIDELNSLDSNGDIVSGGSKLQYENEKQQELNKMVYKIDLLRLSERTVYKQMVDSLVETQQIEFARIDPETWLNCQTMHTPEYFRLLLSPLLRLITESTVVIYSQKSEMQVIFENTFIPMEKISDHLHDLKILKSLSQGDAPKRFFFSAVIRLQKIFKGQKQMLWHKISSERRAQLEIKSKLLGQPVKRGIRLIDGKRYIVNIYQKSEGTNGQQNLTFDLLPYTDSLMDRKDFTKRCRGHYIWDSTQMLNIGSKTLYDYLIDQIYIESNMVKFMDSEFHNFNTIKELAVYQDLEHHEGWGKLRLTCQPTQEFKFQPIDNFIDQLMGPEKLVNQYQGSSIGDGRETTPDTIYNVVYTGQSRLKTKQTEIEENTVQIEVNLDNVRKLYPTLNTSDGNVMKAIGQQLIDGIRINNKGELLVDQSKINPNFIDIKSSTLAPIQERIENGDSSLLRQQSNANKPSYTKILAKKTTYFQNTKYLIVINYVERKITKILKQSVDQVFEEYEIIYQIMASNLTSRAQNQLIWELGPEQAVLLSHQREKSLIAHSIIKRILIRNDQFLCLVDNKIDLLKVKLLNPHVHLISEIDLRPLLQFIKNRALVKNYKIYKQRLASWRYSFREGFLPQVALHSLESLHSTHRFIVFCVEDSQMHIIFNAWDVQTFELHEIEIPRHKVKLNIQYGKFLQLLTNAKNEAIRTLCKFVEFKSDLKTKKLTFAPPNTEKVLEIFQQQKDLSAKQLIIKTQTNAKREAFRTLRKFVGFKSDLKTQKLTFVPPNIEKVLEIFKQQIDLSAKQLTIKTQSMTNAKLEAILTLCKFVGFESNSKAQKLTLAPPVKVLDIKKQQKDRNATIKTQSSLKE